MSPQTDEAASDHRYALSCVECSFQTTVDGDVFDAFDVADTHREACADNASEHFVEFVLDEER